VPNETLPPSTEAQQRTNQELESDNADLRTRVKRLEERVEELNAAADEPDEDEPEDEDEAEPWED